MKRSLLIKAAGKRKIILKEKQREVDSQPGAHNRPKITAADHAGKVGSLTARVQVLRFGPPKTRAAGFS